MTFPSEIRDLRNKSQPAKGRENRKCESAKLGGVNWQRALKAKRRKTRPGYIFIFILHTYLFEIRFTIILPITSTISKVL